MRIPLFVSASGILVVVALGFAVGLRVLAGTFERRCVRAWYRAWLGLAVYAATAGLALLAVNVPALTPLRELFSATSLIAAAVHLHALAEGTWDLAVPGEKLPRWQSLLLGVAFGIALLLVLLPDGALGLSSMQMYLARIVLVAIAWAVAYAAAGVLILRRLAPQAGISRATLAISLLSYGALRLIEPAMHFVGPSPILAQVLSFGGLPLLVGLGAGTLMVLLEVEHERAIHAIEASATAERSASEAEALLATALAGSADPVFVVAPDGKLLTFNARFREIVAAVLGVEPQAGTPLDALFGGNTPGFWHEAFSRALCGEAQHRIEPLVLRPADAPRMFAIRVTPVLRDGAAVAALVVAHDATEEERLRSVLARRDRWFRSLIENASDILLEISPDLSIDYASPAVERILARSAELLPGTSLLAIVHTEDAERVRVALARFFAEDPDAPATVPFRTQHADGSYVQLEASARPFQEPDGTPHLILTARDVSERHRLESALMAARRLESIGRLAGGVAHDFNNLLTVMLGNVAVLKAGEDGPEAQADHVEELARAVSRGSELTKRLLAFARQRNVEPRPTSLDAFFRDLAPLLRRLLGNERTFVLESDPSAWPVLVDTGAFEQAIVNLVANARDATSGGDRVRIAVENVTLTAGPAESLRMDVGDWVRIDVEDSGAGMDETVLEHVFEPFFTTKERSGGTGLGLATTYGSVAQAGGHIRVRSTVGCGSTFSIYLPRSRELAVRARTPEATQLLRAAEGEVVLLIDDDRAVRDVTAKLLRRIGYTVLVAEDGHAGLAQATDPAQRIDVVVSDVVMPGLGGLEAVALIREQRPGLPAVFISGYNAEAARWQERESAPGPLVAKPFAIGELATRIREELDRPREVTARDLVANDVAGPAGQAAS